MFLTIVLSCYETCHRDTNLHLPVRFRAPEIIAPIQSNKSNFVTIMSKSTFSPRNFCQFECNNEKKYLALPELYGDLQFFSLSSVKVFYTNVKKGAILRFLILQKLKGTLELNI